jgi:hypothetical protein
MTGDARFVRGWEEEEPNMSVYGVIGGIEVQFVAISGCLRWPEKVIPKVLKDANVVVYVLEGYINESTPLNFTNEYHEQYLNHYLHYASILGVDWDRIPWVLALSKIDWAPHIPSIAHIFPESLLHNIKRCIAPKGIGTQELWTEMTELITHQ